jgi:CheY-like chemotaxis protein
MSLYRVLVVDDDPWMHRIIATHLSGLSLKIDTADEGTTALAKALATNPDLIISDVMMPGMDGWALVREIRAHARFAFVPFIFLTSLSSAGDLLRGFRLGADDFLCKPFGGDQLVERVLSALKRSERTLANAQARLGDSHGCGLRGTLADVGLASLLTLFEMERKTGLLALTRKSPRERCRIFLRDGAGRRRARPTSKPGSCTPSRSTTPCTGPRGRSASAPSPIEVNDCVQMSTTQLLIDGARRLDEAMRSTLMSSCGRRRVRHDRPGAPATPRPIDPVRLARRLRRGRRPPARRRLVEHPPRPARHVVAAAAHHRQPRAELQPPDLAGPGGPAASRSTTTRTGRSAATGTPPRWAPTSARAGPPRGP